MLQGTTFLREGQQSVALLRHLGLSPIGATCHLPFGGPDDFDDFVGGVELGPVVGAEGRCGNCLCVVELVALGWVHCTGVTDHYGGGDLGRRDDDGVCTDSRLCPEPGLVRTGDGEGVEMASLRRLETAAAGVEEEHGFVALDLVATEPRTVADEVFSVGLLVFRMQFDPIAGVDRDRHGGVRNVTMRIDSRLTDHGAGMKRIALNFAEVLGP